MMTKKNRKENDPYAEIRREVPPPDFPMESKKYNRKRFRERTDEFIERGVEEYFNEEYGINMVGSLNTIRNKDGRV